MIPIELTSITIFFAGIGAFTSCLIIAWLTIAISRAVRGYIRRKKGNPQYMLPHADGEGWESIFCDRRKGN